MWYARKQKNARVRRLCQKKIYVQFSVIRELANENESLKTVTMYGHEARD